MTINYPKIARNIFRYLHWHQRRGVATFQERFQTAPSYIEPGTNTATKTARIDMTEGKRLASQHRSSKYNIQPHIIKYMKLVYQKNFTVIHLGYSLIVRRHLVK